MGFKSQPALTAIPIILDHLPEYYWYLHFFNTQEMPDMTRFERKIWCDGTSRRLFSLIEKDRFLLTSIVNFIKTVRDPFIMLQVHGIIRFILECMVLAPSIEAFIHVHSFLDLIIILNLLDLSENIGNWLHDFRRNACRRTVFNTIEDRLDPHYPHSS